jgi:hypothetical protein
MSDAKELNDDSERPGMNRKPSVEIRCRLADNLRRYRYYRGYTQERLGKFPSGVGQKERSKSCVLTS